ncbi:unnamed protein product [Boreogadus saida]
MAGIEQGSLAKDYAVSQWVFGRVRVSHCWCSGWLLGSVVPWGAADSLVHEGEVLSLAEFSADTHKRHKAGEQSVSLCQEGQSKRSRRKLAGTISRQSGREGEQADCECGQSGQARPIWQLGRGVLLRPGPLRYRC